MATRRIRKPRVTDIDSSISKINGGSGIIMVNMTATSDNANCTSGDFIMLPMVKPGGFYIAVALDILLPIFYGVSGQRLALHSEDTSNDSRDRVIK